MQKLCYSKVVQILRRQTESKMTDDFDREKRKNRKKQIGNKNKTNYDVSEEQKFMSKAKKAFKNKVRNLQQEEAWEDWQDEIY